MKNLRSAVKATEIDRLDLKLVKHRDTKHFAIASIPEYMGIATAWDRQEANADVDFSRAPAIYCFNMTHFPL